MRTILNVFSQRDQSQNGQPRAAPEQEPTVGQPRKLSGLEIVVP
jgi:hypothetical protein